MTFFISSNVNNILKIIDRHKNFFQFEALPVSVS